MSKTKQPAMTFARKQSVVATGLALSLMAAQAVYAQRADRAQKVERIEVTGSNIKRIEGESANLVQVITRQDIERTGAFMKRYLPTK